MGTYVVGDIHGNFNEWMYLKRLIEKEDNEAKFIVVGDIVDRGKQVNETINWFKLNSSNHGKYQLLMGNHEYMKIQLWTALKHEIIKYSGRQNIWSMSDDEMYEVILQLESGLPSQIIDLLYVYDDNIKLLKSDIDFFKSLPYYKMETAVDPSTGEMKKYVIAHADIPKSAINNETNELKPQEELTVKEKDFIVWNRDSHDFTKMNGVTLIHGHTPTIIACAFVDDEALLYGVDSSKFNYGKIYKQQHRINVDCGITYRANCPEANLAAIRLGDEKEFYIL